MTLLGSTMQTAMRRQSFTRIAFTAEFYNLQAFPKKNNTSFVLIKRTQLLPTFKAFPRIGKVWHFFTASCEPWTTRTTLSHHSRATSASGLHCKPEIRGIATLSYWAARCSTAPPDIPLSSRMASEKRGLVTSANLVNERCPAAGLNDATRLFSGKVIALILHELCETHGTIKVVRVILLQALEIFSHYH